MSRVQTRHGQPAVYNASEPTLVDGDGSSLAVDVNKNLKTTNTTLAAGEDLTNDVQKVEQRFSYATIKTLATTTIKSGAGFVHSITIIGGTLGTIAVYDNTAASGTEIIPSFTPTATLPCPTMILDETFSTGLTIITGAATIINISYR